MWARDFRQNPASETAMNLSSWIGQFHRWMSVVFITVVAAIFTMLGSGNEPAQWVYYLPLLPLAFLTLTGLYMFALPYVARGRTAARE
jgi:ABC-type polysaccharide/polyol phosphate export permease